MNRPKETDPKPQIPAVGIMLRNDYGDSKYYRIACDCGCAEHDIDVCIEADELGVTMHTWTTVKTAWWSKTFEVDYGDLWIKYATAQFANEVINRVKLAYQAVFKGYFEMEGCTIMTKQQAINVAATINSAVKDVEEIRKAEREKREKV